MKRCLTILVFVLSMAVMPLSSLWAQEGGPAAGGGNAGGGGNGGDVIIDPSNSGPVNGSGGNNNGAGGTNAGGSQSIETDEFTGAITHSVTIPAPPSRGGIEPQLAINYHSHRRNPNSWVGYGWELDLGQIIRLPQETTLDEVEGDADDAAMDVVNNVIDPISGTSFEARFGGQSETLVRIGENVDVAEFGIPLAPGWTADQYSAKVETSFNVYLHLTAHRHGEHVVDLNDQGWIVIDKSGKQYHFGRSIRTRDEKVNSAFEEEGARFGIDRWLLERVVDSNGNTLNIAYGDDLLLDRITYNDIVIEFKKSNRAKYFPIFKESFLAPAQISRQLDAVIIRQGNQRLQKFVLRYKNFQNGAYHFIDEIPDAEFKPGYSYLGSVQQFGRNDGTFLPPTTFDYYAQPESQETKPRFGARVLTSNANLLWKNSQFSDMNGDGYVDRILITVDKDTDETKMRVYWNIYEQGFQRRGLDHSVWNVPPDFCQDDKEGLLDWCKDNLTYSTNNGADQKLFLMDMNGDGLPDRVRTHHKKIGPDQYKKTFIVSYNSGSKHNGWLGPAEIWDDPVWEYDRHNAGISNGNAGLIDINGDGLVDRIAQSQNKKGFIVCLNKGFRFQKFKECRFWADPVNVTGSFAAEQQESAVGHVYYYKNGDQRAFIRDFNGDGLPDRIWKAKFYEFGPEVIDRNGGGFHHVRPKQIGTGFMVALNRNGEGWASPSKCPLPPEQADIVVRPAPPPNANAPQPDDFECEAFQQFNNIDILALQGPTSVEDEPTFFKKPIGKEADFMDMNGDGYLDWVEGARVDGQLGFNVSFYKGSSPELDFVQYSPFVFIADPINHQGGEDEGRGYIFKGIPTRDDYSIHTLWRDMNGDGYPDRVSLEPARLRNNDNEVIDRKFEIYPLELNAVQFAENRNRKASQSPGKLKLVDNGYGQLNAIEYYPSVWPYLDELESKHRFMPLNLFVAHKVYTSDFTLPHHNIQPSPINRWPNFRETTYRYNGGNLFVRYANDAGKDHFAQFNGFQQVIKESKPAPGERWPENSTITYYHQGISEAPLVGRNFKFINEAEDEQRDLHFSLSGKTYRQDLLEGFEAAPSTRLVIREKWRITNPADPDDRFNCGDRYCLSQLIQTKKLITEANQRPRGSIVDYEYDATGNVTHQTSRNVQGVEHLTTVTTFHPEGHFAQNPMIRDRIETQIEMTGGQVWRTKNLKYDNNGNPIGESYVANANQSMETMRQFGPNGIMHSMTDADGIEKQLIYDNANLFPLQEKVRVVGNQFLITRRTYNRLTGKVENETTPGNVAKRTVYDDFGRPLEEYIRDTQGSERLSKKYRYELVEDHIVAGHGGLTLLKTSLWMPQEGYDETNPNNENSKPFQVSWSDFGGIVLQECTYSERGNYRQVLSRTRNGGRINIKTEPTFSDNCDFVSSIPQDSKVVQSEQDFQGRQTRQDLSQGDVGSPMQDVTYTYATTPEGYIQKTTHLPNNQTRIEVFDDQDRLLRLTDSNGSTLRYDFNPAGDLVSITGNGVELVETQYDLLGRKVQTVDANLGTWRYVYDDNGRLTEQTDNKGQRITYEYTSLGRVQTKRVFNANGALEKRDVYFYDRGDGAHNVILGELFKVEEYNGQNRLLRSSKFGYEPLYRRNSKITRTIPNLGSFEQTIEYDVQGHITRTVYPSGEDLFYEYNRIGKLQKVCREITCKLSNHEVYYHINPEDGYDVYGGLLKENFGNGIEGDYAYYGNSHRLQSKTLGTQRQIYFQRNYTYDANNNITSLTDPRNSQGTGGLQFARYDNLNRLISYQNQGSPNAVNMAYDEKGNILSNPTSFGNNRYQYNSPRPHAVTQIGNTQFAYDDNGNMTDDGERAMVYNAENQLTRVTMRNGTVVDYEYDYTGGRVSKKVRREDPLHQIHETITHFLGQALEIKEGRLLFHIHAGDTRVASKSLGSLAEIQRAAGAGLVAPTNFEPPFEWNQLIPYAMLFFILFVIASFRPVRAPPIFVPSRWLLAARTPLSLDGRGLGRGWIRHLRMLLSRIHFLLATSNQQLATIWSSYTHSLHEAFHQIHKNKALKLISISLIFIHVLELPYLAYAQVNPPRPQATDISDADYFVYHHGDHLGSTSIITEGKDESRHAGMVYKKGDLLQRFEYEPFGKEKFALNSNLQFDPRYTGQEYDIETGLYYYNARYYNPKLARFTQPDTITPDAKDLQAFNKYSYVLNNPLKYTDPTGHFAFIPFLIVIAIGAAIGAISAAISGGNILMGALTGAISAAIFYGAGSFLSAISPAIQASAQASQAAVLAVTKVVVHVAAGALAGAINAAITGGSIGMGALVGGISAGISKGVEVAGLIPAGKITELIARSFIGGVTGGLAAEMYGGRFIDGFRQGALTAAYGFIFNDLLHSVGDALRNYSVMKTINAHNADIERSAAANGVKPNLIKAIIYEEQSHLLPFEGTGERLGIGNTVGLGQVTVGLYGYSREQLLNPSINIEVIGKHLGNLQANYGTDVGTLGTRYNCGSCGNTTDYGNRVRDYYNHFNNAR